MKEFHDGDGTNDDKEESIDDLQTLAKINNVIQRKIMNVSDKRIIIDWKAPLVLNEAPYQSKIEHLLFYD